MTDNWIEEMGISHWTLEEQTELWEALTGAGYAQWDESKQEYVTTDEDALHHISS